MLLKQTKDVYLPMIQDIIVSAIKKKQEAAHAPESIEITKTLKKRVELKYGLDEFFSFSKAIESKIKLIIDESKEGL